MQASYSLGLRHVATATTYINNGAPIGSYGIECYNRAAQVALSYLFGAED